MSKRYFVTGTDTEVGKTVASCALLQAAKAVGYRTAGYFFVWLRDNKDPEFLRKFNRSTLEVIPWSFDGAIKHILGTEYSIDELWHEYQVAVGDIQV